MPISTPVSNQPARQSDAYQLTSQLSISKAVWCRSANQSVTTNQQGSLTYQQTSQLSINKPVSRQHSQSTGG